MKILYDGWTLIYQPNSPAALHLAALLARRPSAVEAMIALPGAAPEWLPEGVVPLVRSTANRPWAHLRWEQFFLPHLARETRAGLLHLVTPGAGLFATTPILLSPGESWGSAEAPKRQEEAVTPLEHSGSAQGGRLGERLRRSLGQGGLARLGGLIWPDDLPDPEGLMATVPLFRLPPAVHPGFSPPSLFSTQDLSSLNLPDTYVLYHGSSDLPSLQRLLNAWSWAAGAIGDSFPLVLLGSGESGIAPPHELFSETSFEKTFHTLPPVPFTWLSEIYRGCASLFYPSPTSPWGSPVRHALACERPVVAAENPMTNAMVGPAAYLAPAGEPRALGAALITVVVEDEVSGSLMRAAGQRAASWKSQAFVEALLEAYRSIISAF